MIIINADDWGRTQVDTDATLTCFREGSVTSVSAMVFMVDSERAATLARDTRLDIGLHLNFTEKYTAARDTAVVENHARIVRFLTASKYALLVYHPFLRQAFRSVYESQVAEFRRLYGKPPSHIDGHQHMHLCSNVVFDRLIPKGEKVRRHFSFFPGEKGFVNRSYRGWVDDFLAQRYRMTDYFFSLEQNLRNGQLGRIAGLAKSAIVEMMTHARMPAEFAFLRSAQRVELFREVQLGTYASI